MALLTLRQIKGAPLSIQEVDDNFNNINIELTTNLDAAALARGIVPDARLSGTYTGVSITGNATTATRFATARTIALSGAATGTATSFNGTANITIPVTGLNANNLNAGIVPDARLSGTYTGVSITGNAATADLAAAATILATARTIAISGGATGTATSFDGSANISIPITALDASSLATGTVPSARLTGSYDISITGNSATATVLETARTIAISGGATGTATSFNGSANITIPITGLNANNLNAGTVPSARLTGSYAISITGSAATLTTARTIAISGGATGTATAFDGSANISITVTSLDATALTGIVPNASISGSYTGFVNLTGSGTVDFSKFLGNAADTAAAPSFSWTGDTNTGIWKPAADQLGFSTGGTNRLTITTTAITSTLNITAPTFIGALTGNATTATTLATARAINGVNFNGSAAITVPTNNTADNASTATHFVSFSASSATGNTGSKVSTKLTFQPSTGNFTASGDVTAFSDERLKTDWSVHGGDIIERIAAVKNGTFTRTDTNARQTGVSAQSLHEVLPEAVIENDDGILSVSYGNAALTLVVELAKQLVELKAEIKKLKGE